LRPKKAKEFIPTTSKKVELDSLLVEDVVLFYWQEIRKNLSSLNHVRIHLSNLGDFTIKHWKLDEKLEYLSEWKDKNEQEGKQKMNERYKIEQNIINLKEVKQLLDEENQRKDFIKLHKRKSNESKEQHIQNLEEQRSDNTGDC
jgi:UDP-galactopyranose mutase